MLWRLIRRARQRAVIRAVRHDFRARLGDVVAQHCRFPGGAKWGGSFAYLVHVAPQDWHPWTGPVGPRPPRVRRRKWWMWLVSGKYRRSYRYACRSRRADLRIWRRNRLLVGAPIIPVLYVCETRGAMVNLRAFRIHATARMGHDSVWDYDAHGGTLTGAPYVLPSVIDLPDINYLGPDPQQLVPVGVLDTGGILTHDLELDLHAKIGGGTRKGKTNTLRAYVAHALRTGFQAVIVVDPEGTEFRELRGLPWNPETCTGVLVVTQAAKTAPDSFAPIVKALDAFEAERERRQAEAIKHPDIDVAEGWSRVMLVMDETADTFDPEPVPSGRPSADEPDDVKAARARNLDRYRIARATTLQVRRSGKRKMTVVFAAQSLRVDALGGGSASTNFGFAAVVGPSTLTELRLTFDTEVPESPPPEAGRMVARDRSLDFDPRDPYVRAKTYRVTSERLTEIVNDVLPVYEELLAGVS